MEEKKKPVTVLLLNFFCFFLFCIGHILFHGGGIHLYLSTESLEKTEYYTVTWDVNKKYKNAKNYHIFIL